jgi:hypothetical protein
VYKFTYWLLNQGYYGNANFYFGWSTTFIMCIKGWTENGSGSSALHVEIYWWRPGNTVNMSIVYFHAAQINISNLNDNDKWILVKSYITIHSYFQILFIFVILNIFSIMVEWLLFWMKQIQMNLLDFHLVTIPVRIYQITRHSSLDMIITLKPSRYVQITKYVTYDFVII